MPTITMDIPQKMDTGWLGKATPPKIPQLRMTELQWRREVKIIRMCGQVLDLYDYELSEILDEFHDELLEFDAAIEKCANHLEDALRILDRAKKRVAAQRETPQ